MNTNYTHTGITGKTLVQKIEDKLDKAYDDWIDGADSGLSNERRLGRAEGVAAALGILRSTTTSEEMDRAEDRRA